jgi:ribosomal protein S18 acetylase RimI-like enzyme
VTGGGNGQLDRLLPADPAGTGRPEPPLPLAAPALPARLPAHLARKLTEPATDRSRQLAGLVAAAVEWGLDDGEVLSLALAHRPTQERRQTKGTNISADVARLLAKLRPTHAHVGQPCDAAGCPNTPSWMRTRPETANGQPTRPLLPPPVAAVARPTPINANGQPAATSAGWSGPVAELLELLATYVHLDDPGHVWFALAVAASAALDGDPLWGMLIGPSSSGKTEALRALDTLAEPIDEVTAPALLSWTHGRKPQPTGVLTRIGERGLVTVGDFSTVLATSDRGGRDQLFALLRRVYDGQVTRDLGNAPVPLRWSGRLTLLAACTPAIDNYASHADQLGPRWLYYRLASASSEGKRATSRKARLRPGDLARLRGQAAQLAGRLVAGAQDKAAGVRLSEQAAERLDDLAIVCCFGRAVVPRNAYGRREIEGLAIVEEPPRLVGQLLLLARGLLALGLVETAVVGLCRRAALDSIPQVRRRLLHALAEDDEVSVSEAARRVGCDRRVARMGLEELAAIGLATCPALDDEDQEEPEDAPGRWSAHPWRLAGPDQPLVRAVLQGRPWDEAWGASPDKGEGERKGRGGGVGGPHTSSQGLPATLADPSPAGHLAGELVCPACGQLARPAPGGPGRCPDCAVDLVGVPDPTDRGS